MMRVAVLPDDGPRFLNLAVRIQKHRAHRTGFLVAFDRIDQVIQPAGQHHRVVVEKHQVLPTRNGRALIARFDKTAIVFVSDDANDGTKVGKNFLSFISRSIVDDDDLGLGQIDLSKKRTETLKGVSSFIENRDDDRSANLARLAWRPERIFRNE